MTCVAIATILIHSYLLCSYNYVMLFRCIVLPSTEKFYQLANRLQDKYVNKRHTQYRNEKEQWPPNPLKIIVSIAMITYGNKEPI